MKIKISKKVAPLLVSGFVVVAGIGVFSAQALNNSPTNSPGDTAEPVIESDPIIYADNEVVVAETNEELYTKEEKEDSEDSESKESGTENEDTAPANPAQPSTVATNTVTKPAAVATTRQTSSNLFGGHILAWDYKRADGTSIVNPADVVSDLQRVGVSSGVYNAVLLFEGDLIDLDHPQTPSPEITRAIARAVLNAGMDFEVKPGIINNSATSSWAGDFIPANADTWFPSYFAAIERQYAPAWQEGARTLIIGNEMGKLETDQYTRYWRDGINAIRKKYPGTKFHYNQNWGEFQYGPIPGFFDELDKVGVSAYFPYNGDASDIDQHWREVASLISERNQSTNVNYYVGEFGQALTGTFAAPAGEDKQGSQGRTPNPNQTLSYVRAACSALRSAGLIHNLWTASYTTSAFVNGVDLDAARGFYLGAPENSALAQSIGKSC